MKTKFTVRKPSLTVRESILNLLRKSSKPLDAKTIAKKGKLNYNTVRKELGYLWTTASINYSQHRDWGQGITKYYPLDLGPPSAGLNLS